MLRGNGDSNSGNHPPSTAALYARKPSGDLRIARPERRTVVDQFQGAVTVASTVAKPLDKERPCGQLWDVRPAHRPQRTVLDDLPTPTDL